MLVVYAFMNTALVSLAYPLTLAVMIYLEQPNFYIGVVSALLLNKIWISACASKVRANLDNPNFAYHEEMMQAAISDLKEKNCQEHAKLAAMPKLARIIGQVQAKKVKDLLA
jgi:hypothetical protein